MVTFFAVFEHFLSSRVICLVFPESGCKSTALFWTAKILEEKNAEKGLKREFCKVELANRVLSLYIINIMYARARACVKIESALK